MSDDKKPEVKVPEFLKDQIVGHGVRRLLGALGIEGELSAVGKVAEGLELTALRVVEKAARELRLAAGYESGASSKDLDEALATLDRLRETGQLLDDVDQPACTGQLVHDEFTRCPVHDR
jgi:hypothetical protein